jgi:hypothetical protein
MRSLSRLAMGPLAVWLFTSATSTPVKAVEIPKPVIVKPNIPRPTINVPRPNVRVNVPKPAINVPRSVENVPRPTVVVPKVNVLKPAIAITAAKVDVPRADTHKSIGIVQRPTADLSKLTVNGPAGEMPKSTGVLANPKTLQGSLNSGREKPAALVADPKATKELPLSRTSAGPNKLQVTTKEPLSNMKAEPKETKLGMQPSTAACDSNCPSGNNPSTKNDPISIKPQSSSVSGTINSMGQCSPSPCQLGHWYTNVQTGHPVCEGDCGGPFLGMPVTPTTPPIPAAPPGAPTLSAAPIKMPPPNYDIIQLDSSISKTAALIATGAGGAGLLFPPAAPILEPIALGAAAVSYRQFLVTAGPVRRRRLRVDGRSAWR